MDDINISYAIICFNEERSIKRCLTSIQKNISMEDEILVVDTGSTDRTIKIISENFPNVKLFNFKWTNNFAAARNFAISCAKKNWICFVDCDEVISNYSGKLIKKHIKKLSKVTKRPFALVTKTINTNSYIQYNAGRILPNFSRFKFFGLVHEYLIYDNDLECKNYDLVKISDVIFYHDGYELEIMLSKNKLQRNSKLDKKMLNIFPNNIRCNYLYYRDAKTLIDKKEYVEGMKKTFLMDTNNKFSIFAAFDLISFYVEEKDFDKADKIIDKVSTAIEKPEFRILKWQLVYLSSICEFNKLLVKEGDILKTLLAVKYNHKTELDEIYFNEANYNDLIGLIFLSIGNVKEAVAIDKSLKKYNYNGQLSKKIKKFRKSFEGGYHEKSI